MGSTSQRGSTFTWMLASHAENMQNESNFRWFVPVISYAGVVYMCVGDDPIGGSMAGRKSLARMFSLCLRSKIPSHWREWHQVTTTQLSHPFVGTRTAGGSSDSSPEKIGLPHLD